MNKLTIEDIESKIKEETYLMLGKKTTLCFIILKNGFEIISSSACVDPNIFDFKIGKKEARKAAIDKIWELEGYLLQEKLIFLK